jgi:hypothetical protein
MKTTEEINVTEDYTPSSKSNAKSEKLPISEFYKVLDYYTIFKSDKWWEAIALIETFGKRSIAMYMWQFKDGNWKRKHKFHIRGVNEWVRVRKSVERLLPKLTGQDNTQFYAQARGANSR